MLTLLNIIFYIHIYWLRINPGKEIYRSNEINVLNYIAKFYPSKLRQFIFPLEVDGWVYSFS